MLQALKIDNFALIPHLELQFNTGFSVLTGETGSGKSIILGALNLILGERADYSVIRDANQKTIVEGTFSIKDYDLNSFFDENDLDFSDELIVRREITNQGKSRAFINDTPVQLSVLKALTEKLIHIHSQHHTLELKNADFQFDILDYLTDSFALRTEFKQAFINLKAKQKDLEEKKTHFQKVLQEEDYTTFQLGELEKLNLEKISYSNLEQELEQMEHFDTIQNTFSAIHASLSENNAVIDKLTNLKATLERNKAFHPFFASALERIISVNLELKDIAFEVESFQEGLEFQPDRKIELEMQLSKFNAALMKHLVKNQADLLQIYADFQNKSELSHDLKLEIERLENEILTDKKQLILLGNQLHEKRIASKSDIEKRIQVLLADLKMDKSVIEFALEKTEIPNEYGFSNLSLNFSPNVGLALKPIDKIASGGELSRLMLTIQLMLSEKKQLPTMIFDEIDTGVSGEVAQKLGELLQKMGKTMQLLAITHLPQVAAKGATHFKVSKSQQNDTTVSKVEILNSEEKIIEVARLMSGENINDAAIENAKALMN
ncbi:MAG: DNA repair protein RecN [Flavobacteriia bacterium]